MLERRHGGRASGGDGRRPAAWNARWPAGGSVECMHACVNAVSTNAGWFFPSIAYRYRWVRRLATTRIDIAGRLPSSPGVGNHQAIVNATCRCSFSDRAKVHLLRQPRVAARSVCLQRPLSARSVRGRLCSVGDQRKNGVVARLSTYDALGTVLAISLPASFFLIPGDPP